MLLLRGKSTYPRCSNLRSHLCSQDITGIVGKFSGGEVSHNRLLLHKLTVLAKIGKVKAWLKCQSSISGPTSSSVEGDGSTATGSIAAVVGPRLLAPDQLDPI